MKYLTIEELRDLHNGRYGRYWNSRFDSWLARHDAEVAEAERERIITLLQREASEWISHDGECDCRVKGEEDLRLIALIKGENK